MAKSMYWGGNPSEIWTAPVDEVIGQYQYEIFTRDYEKAYYNLNRTEK